MLLGIDVGGTFTDAVVIEHGHILIYAKTPTTHHNLLEGILNVLDEILTEVDKSKLKRVSLSTTIVTNALIQNRTDKVGLCLIPGPGFDISSKVPVKPFWLSGYIDHRGREVKEPKKDEVLKACEYYSNYDVFAVVGKFSVRNPKHEVLVADWLREFAEPRHITTGSAVSGSLNFLRRTNSAYFNAAVWHQFEIFAEAVEQALRQREVNAPVYILKADGGTVPLEAAKLLPVEAIFTGPAASVLGIMAMSKIDRPAVSLDIGGTTTDIALWHDERPLFAARGASINGFPTAVAAFRLKSVGIGGDSFISRTGGQIQVGPLRKGPAMAAGGSHPTLSDAMIVAGLESFGNKARSNEAISLVTLPGQTINDAAWEVLNKAAEVVKTEIYKMIDEQAAEPVYRVEDILSAQYFNPEFVIGVGGAAKGLAPLVAKQLNVAYRVPEASMVANAIGAAVAKPTFALTLRADTAQGYYTIAELAVKRSIACRKFTLTDANQLAADFLKKRAAQIGIEVCDIEVLNQEEFSMVRGFNSIGKILSTKVQIKPGVLTMVT